MSARSDELLRQAQAALNQRDPARARTLYDTVLAAEPGHPAALLGLANLAILANDAEAVIATIDRLPEALRRRDPVRVALGTAYNNRGARLQRAGDTAAAQRAYEQAVDADPRCMLALINSATLHLSDDQPALAQASLDRALRLQPDNLEALLLAARVDLASGRTAQARQRLAAAETRAAGNDALVADIAEQFLAAGDPDGALARLGRLVATPGGRAFGTRYARLLFNADRPTAAIDYLASRPDLASDRAAQRELARSLRRIGEDERATQTYAAIARASPADVQAAFGSALCLPVVPAGIEHLRAARQRYAEGLDRLEREWLPAYRPPRAAGADDTLAALVWSNFYLAYQGGNDLELQRQFGRLLAGLLQRHAPALLEPRRPRPHARPRVALVSRYWRDCTVGHYFASWIGALRGRGSDVHLVMTGPPDEHTERLRRQANAYHHWPLPPAPLARRLLAQDYDLIVYPELGMDPTCLLLAAMRLAPVQCCAWGHPVTPGLSNIDRYFSCAEMEPPQAQEHYSEPLILLPGLGTRYSPDAAPPPATRSELGLPDDARLYLVPQSPFKLHPDFDAVLVAIARDDPQARWVMFEGVEEGTTARLRRRLGRVFAASGLDAERTLIVHPQCLRQRYLQINRVCDVMVDSLHWSGGNTSLDALSVGLPVVTRPGAFMRGRQSAAMLRRLGLDDLIADTDEALVRQALAVAREPGARAAIAERIERQRSALFDDEAPLESLSAAVAALVG